MKAGRRNIHVSDEVYDVKDMIPDKDERKQELDEMLTGLFVRLPISQKIWLENLADSTGESLAEIVRKALKDYEQKS